VAAARTPHHGMRDQSPNNTRNCEKQGLSDLGRAQPPFRARAPLAPGSIPSAQHRVSPWPTPPRSPRRTSPCPTW
jgi:hypothetical protein